MGFIRRVILPARAFGFVLKNIAVARTQLSAVFTVAAMLVAF